MTIKSSFAFLALCTGVLSACATPGTEVAAISKQGKAAAAADSIIADIGSAYPGITATVYKEDQLVWSYSEGFANLETEARANADTKFNVYSTAKALTGFAFARLEQRGLVSREQSVGELMENMPPQFHKIKIEHILSHSSGIRHYRSKTDWLKFAQSRCQVPRDAIKYFASDALEFVPGTKENYSTFAFVLASALLVDVTDTDDFMEALNTSLGDWADFTLDRPGVAKAQSYVPAGLLPESDEKLPPDTLVPWLPVSAECKFGGGGILASSKQLARAGAALYRGEIIPEDKLANALKPWSSVSNTVYGGAAFSIDINDEPITIFNLSGGAPGGRSYLLVMIEPEISVAIAGNFDGPKMGEAARKIAELWLDHK